MVRPHEHVAGRLAGRIGRIRRVRRRFREVTGRPQAAINLVSGHVMKSFSRPIAAPYRAARLQQIECADDIGVDEIAGTGNRTIHMRFGRQVHHVSDLMILDNLPHGDFVAEINFLERIPGMSGDAGQVGEVPGVSQTIEIDQTVNLRLPDDVVNNVRTDEPGAARDH